MEAKVLLLGDPRLRERAREIEDFDAPEVVAARTALAETLGEFRRRHGFGRAIAAPQIGVPLRMIAVNLGEGPFFVMNPAVTWTSDETFTMWDDCMSFPGLLVRHSRHRAISLTYQDGRGDEHRWERMALAPAELLQHEIDHLDGVLAVDRALDREAIVMREVFDARRADFVRMVDYTIGS
jgi:peptide deformylase